MSMIEITGGQGEFCWCYISLSKSITVTKEVKKGKNIKNYSVKAVNVNSALLKVRDSVCNCLAREEAGLCMLCACFLLSSNTCVLQTKLFWFIHKYVPASLFFRTAQCLRLWTVSTGWWVCKSDMVLFGFFSNYLFVKRTSFTVEPRL